MNLFARSALAALVLVAGVTASLSPAAAYERWVNVENHGSYAIETVRISHVDKDSFGPDLLGRYVIPVGDSMRVEPRINQGYCRFDVEITYETGDEVTLWGVNLCAAETIVADEENAWAI